MGGTANAIAFWERQAIARLDARAFLEGTCRPHLNAIDIPAILAASAGGRWSTGGFRLKRSLLTPFSARPV